MERDGRISVAVQGAGNVGTEHLKAYIANPHCEVVALGGSTKEHAAAKAHQLGLDPDRVDLYDDYAALLAHPGLDALSICTPHARHATEAIAAAEAGKHILIEKPVALTPEALRAMDAAVTAAGVQTTVSFVLRWNPLVTTAKALLDDGAFGRPLYVQTDYWHNAEQGGYPGAKGRLGRGTVSAMVSAGCHAMDLARYLMGSDIVEVMALDFTGLARAAGPVNQVALVRFANGMAGKVSACTEQWMPYQFNIDLLGTDGALRDDRFYSRKMPGTLGWATFPTVLPNSGAVSHHPFPAEIDHFIDCVRTGVESHASLRNTLNTHEACFAVDRSSGAGGVPVGWPRPD